jgi:23S rRNA (uracil1939-C5)-methyltransferase
MTGFAPALDEVLETRGVDKRPGDSGTVEPRCPHFGTCGGCQLQHLPYEEQLTLKTEMVRAAFRTHELDADKVRPMLGAEDPWAYRTKIDLTAKTFAGELHLGFLPYGEKRTLIEFEECPIADPAINEALVGIRAALPRHPELNKKLISIVCRGSRSEGKVGLVFHGKLREPGPYRELGMDIMGETDRVTGGMFVRKRKEHLVGDRNLSETIAGKTFRFPIRSFFQNNPPQTEVLAAKVLELADAGQDEVVLDLYSGVGLFGLLLAEHTKEVYLLEDTPYSAEAAKENAEAFGAENVVSLRGQAEERVELMRRSGQHPNIVILDPPRSGCHEAVVRSLSRFPTRPRIVYVSCNPETHARDCALFKAEGYELQEVWPIDMFPQTVHIESVALLK